MTDASPPEIHLPRPAEWLICGLSILYLGLYLYVVFNRMVYPFELEWMEGCAVDHVLRILSGKSLYGEPSLEFTPYIYTPLFFYVSALMSLAVGKGFFALRLVSFLASIGCFWMLYLFVKRETSGSRVCGILAAGFFAAVFSITGGWFDLGRIDTLFMFLLLTGIYLIRSGDESRFQFAAGICMTLAFLAKQTALIAAGPMMLYALFGFKEERRFVFPVTFLFSLGVVTLTFQWITDGWWNFYIFDLPRSHAFAREMLGGFWVNDLLAKMPAALALTFFLLTHLLVRSRGRDFGFFICLLTGMLAASWLSRLHVGGFDNVLMPLYACMAIFLAVGMHALFETLGEKSPPEATAGAPASHRTGSFLKTYHLPVYLILVCQFALLAYNPGGYIPDEKDLQSGQRFIRLLKDVKGDVFIPWHGFYAAMAGKKQFTHLVPIEDVVRGDHGEISAKLRQELRQAISDRRFEAIVLDKPLKTYMDVINRHYVDAGEIFTDEDGFYPMTGMMTRPDRLFIPRPPSPSP